MIFLNSGIKLLGKYRKYSKIEVIFFNLLRMKYFTFYFFDNI